MRRPRILVVEDEEIVAKDIANQLRAAGYVVAASSSGEDAIRKAARRRPDAVLMDILLRGKMCGVDAAEEISRLDIPVIYLTSYADKDTLSRAKATKPYGYIVKPFKEEDLRAAVEVAIFKHRDEKLNNEEDRLVKSALLCTGSALMITDADMAITFMNDAAEQITGWKKESALKRKVAEVFRISHDKNRAIIDMVAVDYGKRPSINLREDFVLLSKNGGKKKIYACISSVRNAKEDKAGLVIVFHTSGGKKEKENLLSGTMCKAYSKLTTAPMDSSASAILKGVNFIEQNLGGRLSLEHIAQSSGMSKFHFSRSFKRLIGVSPMAFVTSVRTERAGERLKCGTQSISEIAFSVGFNNASHFVEQFKKLTGMTPTEYRKAARELRKLK